MDLATTIRGWYQRPATYLRGEWDRMAPRERRLVGILALAFVLLIALVFTLLVSRSLSRISEGNEDMREALAAIAKHRDKYLEAKSRMIAQEVRIGTGAPQLVVDLEKAATEVGIQIPETTERPAVQAGKRYMEHSVDVKLRQVDLKSLTRFLHGLETSRRLTVITRLEIRRRFSDGEKLDVQLTATAFERVDNRPKKAAGKTAGGPRPARGRI